jgi:hypothetical protein
LQFGPLRGEQGFTVEFGGQSLIFGGHNLSIGTPASDKRKRLQSLGPRGYIADLG